MGSGFRISASDLGGAMGIRTPDLLHAMQVRQPACQRHHRLLPADPVHRRARECLPGAGRWLSTWLSISLDHDLFECLKARCTAHAGNAERCPSGKNTAATVIGDTAGRAPIRHPRPLRRLRRHPAGRESPPATARPPAGATRARGTANDATHMAANTQIRHRHSEDRATKIIHAVPPATEAAVLRLLSLSSSSAQPAGHRGRQDPARTRRNFHRKPAHSSRARNVTKPPAVETLSPYRTRSMRLRSEGSLRWPSRAEYQFGTAYQRHQR
jgi:hypothetical protein